MGAILILMPLGCTSITVTKIAPGRPADKDNTKSQVAGQRFSLPRPYIQVTPQPDGSITADIIYLPDPDHTYAIDSWAFLASDTLDLTTDSGIIKSVNWSGDSSAAVQASITSAGNVASGILQAEQKKQSDQRAKEETAIKAVTDAQLALDQAQADLAIVLATPNAAVGDVLKARYALSDATLKLQATKDALGKLKTGLAAADKPASGDGIYGPKLFAIQEQALTDNQTRLKIMTVTQTRNEIGWDTAQSSQPKYRVARPPTPKPQTEMDLYPKGIKSVHVDDHGNMILMLQSTTPLFTIGGKGIVLDSSGNELAIDVPVALDSPTLITADLKSLKTKPGRYSLVLDGIEIHKGTRVLPRKIEIDILR